MAVRGDRGRVHRRDPIPHLRCGGHPFPMRHSMFVGGLADPTLVRGGDPAVQTGQ